jgi:putative CocE/NonD family hydrolase
VVWIQERYGRSHRQDGRVVSRLETHLALRNLVESGYALAVVDTRGSGASFGKADTGPFSRAERMDAYDVTEWLATQPWSDGKVGMVGSSYSGTAQLMAASVCPPHLKAIFVEMALFDLYGFAYEGGIFREGFAAGWRNEVRRLDDSPGVAPVDGTQGEEQLRAAQREHAGNRDVEQMFSELPYRDSTETSSGIAVYQEQSPSSHVDVISNCDVAVFLLAGWRDIFIRDALLAFGSLRNRRKLVVGSWSHTERDGIDLGAEYRRWFDYFLRSVDNGVMTEPPIRYRTMGESGASAWKSSATWPVASERRELYYLTAGPSGSARSLNDGLLALLAPISQNGRDAYPLDASASSGSKTRWNNGYGQEFEYGDMAGIETKGLTYTSAPLESDLLVTGHPVVHIWLTAESPDQDLFAFLSEIDPQGKPKYVTEGQLRVSHRRRSQAPFAPLNLPYHSGLSTDDTSLETRPVEMVFDLLPTSNLFNRGNRIRLSITGADRGNARGTGRAPFSNVVIHRSAGLASFIEIPTANEKPSSHTSLFDRVSRFFSVGSDG